MRIDAELGNMDVSEAAAEARRLERLGFDAAWTFEAGHDPFLPIGQGFGATEKLHMGTNIAVAFGRSPMSMAQAAWDLQKFSGGRLHLGLGSQVRAHIERRYSMPFDHPAPRLADYVRCLRSIWDTFQNGTKPDYHGEFYQFTLMNPMFNPGPIEHPDIPIYIAGVNEGMCHAAGEVADGFHVHPMHSVSYLRDVVRPAIDVGARRRGRTVEDISLHAAVFAIFGETPAERSKSEAAVRQQVAFYASTPSYRALLHHHGIEDVGKKLSELMRAGRLSEMPALVPDSFLEEVAVVAEFGTLASALRKRYMSLLDRVALYFPVPANDPDEKWSSFVNEFRAA